MEAWFVALGVLWGVALGIGIPCALLAACLGVILELRDWLLETRGARRRRKKSAARRKARSRR